MKTTPSTAPPSVQTKKHARSHPDTHITELLNNQTHTQASQQPAPHLDAQQLQLPNNQAHEQAFQQSAPHLDAQPPQLPNNQAHAQGFQRSASHLDTHTNEHSASRSDTLSSEQVIIDMQHVSFCYPGAEANTLNDVSLRIHRGDFVAIIGSNGSGKSTLCKCLNGLIPAYYSGDFEGKVLVNDIDTSRTTIAQLSRHVAYVFQDFENQLVRPTVFDELCFSPLNFGYEDYKERARHALRMLDIEELAQRWIWQLSGGQKHMVALAAALALDPEVIIVDEPVAQLDPAHAKLIYEKLAMLNETYNKTIIVIEHHTEYIADYCKHVILLDKGGRVRWIRPTNAALSAIDELQELHIQPPQVTQAMAALQLHDTETGLYPVTIKQAVQLLQPMLNIDPTKNYPQAASEQISTCAQPAMQNRATSHPEPIIDRHSLINQQVGNDRHQSVNQQAAMDQHQFVNQQTAIIRQPTNVETATYMCPTTQHQAMLNHQHQPSSHAQTTESFTLTDSSSTHSAFSSDKHKMLIHIDDVTSGYQSMNKQHTATLRHINLTIHQGDRIALVGNNGAGKSTLLRLIAGIRKPWSGTVNVCGKNTRSATPEQLSDDVSFIFQNPEEMFISDHIREDIEFFLKARKQTQIEPFIDHIIDTFNLTELQQRDGRLLSGGQQRRATLAIGLAMKPTVMLLDEPTASLDIVSRREMTKLFDELHNQVQAIVVATHDMQLVADWATRVIVMHDGTILLDTSSEDVFLHPHLLELAALIPPQIVQLSHALHWNKPALSVKEFVARVQKLTPLTQLQQPSLVTINH